MPLLKVENLSIEFTSRGVTHQALKDVSFIVNKGETVALVGESGSGKSITALSILKLLSSPPAVYKQGKIIFSDHGDIETDILTAGKQTIQDLRGHKIGMIFQEPMTSLNPVITCGNQVMESILRHKNIQRQEAKAQTLSWLERVKLPEPLKTFSKYPHQLSGGQKQRVVIAMAMCCHPALLLCDEPTTALDVTVQKTILDLIKELQRDQEMGVLFITHDFGVVAEIADRAIVLYKGEIVEQESVRQLFLHPKQPYTQALLACRPGVQTKGKRLPVVSDFMQLQSDIPQSTMTVPEKLKPTLLSTTENTANETLINVDHLSVSFFGGKKFFSKSPVPLKAVDDVSFVVYEGETLGLVGESGCGKTTLGRALLRLIEPTKGSINYKRTNLLTKSREQMRSLRKDLQIIFQDPYSSLNPRITIGAAIAEPMMVHESGLQSKSRKEKVIELLGKVNMLPSHYNRYPHEFSGGQRQRIVIARALSLNPSFIICDESVSALDVSVQAQVLNLLNDLKREFGFTVIFISHDLSVVRYISDRIMVMQKGKIVETGKAEDIYLRPLQEYTRQLINSIPRGIIG